MHPFFTDLQEFLAAIFEDLLQFRKTHAQIAGEILERLLNMWDAHPFFKIPIRGNTVRPAKDISSIFADDIGYLRRRPGKENPFFSFTVCVLCAVKAAFGAL